MPGEKSLLWKAFDATERAVAPRLEQAVRTGAFAEALGLAARADAAVRRRLEARSRAVWHLVNLPAGSDIVRLRRQVATLDRELRRVSMTLERALADQEPHQEVDDARSSRGQRAPRTQRAAGSGTAGRRAQRAPRP